MWRSDKYHGKTNLQGLRQRVPDTTGAGNIAHAALTTKLVIRIEVKSASRDRCPVEFQRQGRRETK